MTSGARAFLERQKRLPVFYKGTAFDFGDRVDMLVEGRLIVELKAAKAITDVHRAQLLAYLRLSGCHLGLLVNFSVSVLRGGILRLVNGDPNAPPDPRPCRGKSSEVRVRNASVPGAV